MATRMVANINPGDGAVPVEIKVIRKWLSYGRKAECCYIFVDKNGDAIEACGCLGDKSYFDSLISLDICYSLSDYMCENGKTFYMNVPHKTKIRLGKAARLEQIPDEGFPLYYFNLLAYDQLGARLDNHKILTDYIGKVENVYEVARNAGTPILKLKLENLSGTMIEATFWDQSALSFDKQAVEALPSPVIVVVTSMKVTQYMGHLQLTATPASYIYINPEIPENASMAAEFIVRDNQNPVLTIQYEKSKDAEIEKQRNRFTLTQLLSQNPSRYAGVQFTCKASLVTIDQSKGWFYKACHNCPKKLQKRGNTLACEDHGEVAKPNNLFFITAQMVDDTAQAKIVFFNDAAKMLVQTDCNTLIDHLGYTDPNTLPAPVSMLIGQKKIFQFRFTRFCKPEAMDFVADAVFEDIVSPDKESHIYIDSINQPTGSIIAVPVPSSTPTTPPKTSVQQVTTTPITPPSTQTKQHLETSAQKQLFHESSGEIDTKQPKKQKKSEDATNVSSKTRSRGKGKEE